MKWTIQFLVFGIALLFLQSCDKEEDSIKPISDSINKIMPLGASRVEGNRPDYESFRYELWKDLVENDWAFDFIGTQTDEASYPTFNEIDFDADHEGRGGWTSGEILNELEDWIAQSGTPDIVLFSSPGGNDALQNLPYDQTISNINAIIDLLQTQNPDVTIIVELLAPGHSDIMVNELNNYFTQIQEDLVNIAAEQNTASSQVITVDMFTGFSDNLLADDVHYNEAGAAFVADRYYDILVDILED